MSDNINITRVETGKKLQLVETDNINKVPFNAGQYIIVDNGIVYYDPTNGLTLEDRKCLTPTHGINIYERNNNQTDEHYLSLQTNPVDGDLVIIKDLIPNSTNYSYIIYLYNSNSEDNNDKLWCKLTGSQNAKDIFLNSDINITAPITQILNEPKVIKASGKNIEEVLNSIFSPELNPVIVQPSASISFPNAGSYEIGSVVIPKYSIGFNSGDYEYGPDTNVEAITYTATSSNGDVMNTSSGDFASITVTDSTSFYVTADVTHSAGAIPLTNKNNEYLDGQISEGTVSVQSSRITGYVNGLFYGGTENDITTGITSDIIRGLNKTNKNYKAETITINIPVGTKSIILACPNNKTGVTKVYNNTVNADMTTAFGNPTEILVKGNNTDNKYATTYNVWTYTPAEAYSVVASLSITLG